MPRPPAPAALLQHYLREYFGFAGFWPGQLETIEAVCAGRDALAVLPTGGGKSLCYQLPALVRKGTVLVISPLIALMKDQVDALVSRFPGAATYVNSSLPRPEQLRRLHHVAQGQYRIVYLAPERLRSPALQARLRSAGVWLLVVDEAHCISEWGHDFRPHYLQIRAFTETLGETQTLALTATATPAVRQDIVRQLELFLPEAVVTSADRPNLFFEVQRVANTEAAEAAVLDQCRDLSGSAITYCGTRRASEEVAALLTHEASVPADSYHAGMSRERRKEVQERFMVGELQAVAATSAFGMGIDKPDVRLVLHLNHPRSLEEYYQGAGRAGRDGEPARCVLLYCPEDRALHEHFIDSDEPTGPELQSFFAFLAGQLPTSVGTLSDEQVLGQLQHRDAKVRVMLKELEQVGALEVLSEEHPSTKLRLHERTLPGHWQAAATRAITRRKSIKREQLAKIIDYATGDRCRREVILSHFDSDRLDSDLPCCDRCHPDVATVTPGSVAVEATPETTGPRTAVLRLADELDGRAGALLLAQIVHGAELSIDDAEHAGLEAYASCAHVSVSELLSLVGQLVTDGYLALAVGGGPGLALTAAGRRALRRRAGLGVAPAPAPSRQSARLVPLNDWGLTGACLAYQGRFRGSDYVRTPVGELVYQLKYQGRRDCAAELAAHCVDALGSSDLLGELDLLIPVPGTLQREFDPVTEVATRVADASELTVVPLLRKVRATRPQKEMPTEIQKEANVRGAFALIEPSRATGRRCLLFDDLIDSGATMRECARVLGQARPAAIRVLGLTRALHSM